MDPLGININQTCKRSEQNLSFEVRHGNRKYLLLIQVGVESRKIADNDPEDIRFYNCLNPSLYVAKLWIRNRPEHYLHLGSYIMCIVILRFPLLVLHTLLLSYFAIYFEQILCSKKFVLLLTSSK